MKPFATLLLALTVCIATSCSNSDPTSAARSLLEAQCTQDSNGYLKLTKFVKHDAVAQKIMGVDYYTVKYSIEAEAIRDGGYVNICESDGKHGKLLSFEVRSSPNKGDCHVFPAEKGHVYQFDETGFPARRLNHEMKIAKHEKGWVIER